MLELNINSTVKIPAYWITIAVLFNKHKSKSENP